jgi:hypothetical protein
VSFGLKNAEAGGRNGATRALAAIDILATEYFHTPLARRALLHAGQAITICFRGQFPPTPSLAYFTISFRSAVLVNAYALATSADLSCSSAPLCATEVSPFDLSSDIDWDHVGTAAMDDRPTPSLDGLRNADPAIQFIWLGAETRQSGLLCLSLSIFTKRKADLSGEQVGNAASWAMDRCPFKVHDQA